MTIATVASNAPKIFTPRDGIEFLPLGEKPEKVDLIILALRKNWGASSVDQIDTLRHWLAKYPSTTPRYIVGCEATMPDNQLPKYRNKARDTAVESSAKKS